MEPLRVPARTIPVPQSISPAAQQALAPGLWGEALPYPSPADDEGWREFVRVSDEGMLAKLGGIAAALGAMTETIDAGGVPVHVVTPAGVARETERRLLLDFHGGGLLLGGGECCRAMAAITATRLALPTWSVDYRMPPAHPYPAALDDALAVYRALLRERSPHEIFVAGGSAGANIAAALVLRARDERLPLPAGAVLLTPEIDLTESGDSFQTNLGIDNVLTRSCAPLNALYAADHDLADPYLSPLFGDFAAGFPPTFLQAGTRDLFLSNAVRMHRKLRAAGVPAELHIFEAMPHGGFLGAPEDLELDREVRRFIDAYSSPVR